MGLCCGLSAVALDKCLHFSEAPFAYLETGWPCSSSLVRRYEVLAPARVQ